MAQPKRPRGRPLKLGTFLTIEDRTQAICTMRAAGSRIKNIARNLGVSEGVVHRTLHDSGLTRTAAMRRAERAHVAAQTSAPRIERAGYCMHGDC